MILNKRCPECGKHFLIPQSPLGYRKNAIKYCSPDCAAIAREKRTKDDRARIKEERARGRQGKSCEYCGKSFIAARSDSKFCSTSHRVLAYMSRRFPF